MVLAYPGSPGEEAVIHRGVGTGSRVSGCSPNFCGWGAVLLVFLVCCGQTTVVLPVCCCVWMRTLLLLCNLCIRWACYKSGYRAPEHTYHVTELVGNRTTPLGWRQQCRFVTLRIAAVSNVRLSLVALVRSATTSSSRTAQKCVLQY